MNCSWGILALVAAFSLLLLFGCCGSIPITPPEPEKPAPEEFKDLMQKGKNAEYTARYHAYAYIEGEDENEWFTIFRKGKNTRIDTRMTLDTGPEEVSVYMLDDEGYVCIKADNICMRVEGYDFEAEFDMMAEISDNPDEYEVTGMPARTIMNIACKCFSVSGGEIDTSYDVCYSVEGVLMSFETESGQDRMTIDVQTVKMGGISNDEFELPAGAEIIEITDL